MSNRTVILQRPMFSRTTTISTGTANQSNILVMSIEDRKYLRIVHTDPDNRDVVPMLSMGNNDATPYSFPLGSYGSYWECGVPSTTIRIYCPVANLKITVEEGF